MLLGYERWSHHRHARLQMTQRKSSTENTLSIGRGPGGGWGRNRTLVHIHQSQAVLFTVITYSYYISRGRFPGWVKTFPHVSHLWQGKAVDSWRGRWLWSDRASMLDSAPGDHQLWLENSSNPFGVPCIFTNKGYNHPWASQLRLIIMSEKYILPKEVYFRPRKKYKWR